MELPPNFSGVVPSLCMESDMGPPRSECGIGALVPFAGRVWGCTYVSHRKRSGTGTGLYEIDENLKMIKRPESYPGTYANRMIHHPTNQLFIGPWVIDADRNIRTIEPLKDIRLAGTATHLTDPNNKIYMLGMEGELFEVDVKTLETKQIADLVKLLDTPGEGRVHFKDIYTGFGRVVVADNTYDEADFEGKASDGRLAEWDGKGEWKILERKPFVSMNGMAKFAGSMAMFAQGWDRASAILKVFTGGAWSTYRFPKASHNFDHMWQTEWPRIRSIEHERFMMDAHGMFYELSPHTYGGKFWGMRPISTHLWVIPDFCSWRGLLFMGSDNASYEGGGNLTCAQPGSGVWVGKTDDLWHFGGKPKGWGGPWWEDRVQRGVPSDPYLMTGFEHKCIHLSADDHVQFRIEVDFQGNGAFKHYATLGVEKNGYAQHTFPTGFSAHWVRVVADTDCVATAQLHYT